MITKISLISCLLLFSSHIHASTALREMKYNGVSRLLTNRLRANVTIHTYEGVSNKATISCESAENEAENEEIPFNLLTISHDADTLKIENKSAMDVDQDALPHINITLPESTILNLSIAGGEWYIEKIVTPSDICISGSKTMQPLVRIPDINNNSVIHINGGGDVHVDNFHGTEITAIISGSGHIEIENLDVRNAYLTTSYEGEMWFKKGLITKKLIACNSGVNNINIDGSVHDAHLTLTNSGHIYVKMITGNKTQSISGSGHVASDNRPNIENAYMPKHNP